MKKKYISLNSANFRLDGGAMFGIIPRPLWSTKMPPDSENRIDMSLRLLLIEHGDRKVLIDTGIGDYHGDKFNQRFDIRIEENSIEKLLNSHNLNVHDITDLIISHLHFDHIGGMASYDQDKGKLVNIFDNALIHLHKKHFQYSQAPTDRDAGSFQSINYMDIIQELDKNQKVHWLTEEEGEIIPELKIKYKCSHGHTPYMIHPYDDRFFYMADLIPTKHHIKTAWVMGYDISPGITSKEKVSFLKFIFENQLEIIFEHDPEHSSATIDYDTKKGYFISELKEEFS